MSFPDKYNEGRVSIRKKKRIIPETCIVTVIIIDLLWKVFEGTSYNEEVRKESLKIRKT